MAKNPQRRKPEVATSSIRGYWHAELSKSAIATGLKKFQKTNPKVAVLGDLMESLEVIWLMKDNAWREFFIVNGIAHFNNVIPYSEKKGSRILHVPVMSGAFSGIAQYELKEDKNHRLVLEGRNIPLSFVDEVRTVDMDIGSFTGMATAIRGRKFCCTLCYLVHDTIGIHELDCICCLAGCGFGCSPF